jgi:predicted lipoprotein with Yx(FWY)xxD motif
VSRGDGGLPGAVEFRVNAGDLSLRVWVNCSPEMTRGIPMLRRHGIGLAVLVAAAAVVLSACDPATGQAQNPATPATAGAADLAVQNVQLTSGTAKTNNAAPNTGDLAIGPDGTANTAPAQARGKWVQLRKTKVGALDPVLINGAGLTLYRWDKDSANPPKSTCNGQCAVTWPPITITPGAKVFLAGVKRADVGVVRRDDGQLQVTVGGWPAYRFSKDTKPGDTFGQGVAGTWFGLRPDGGKSGVGGGSGTDGGSGAPGGGSGANAAPGTQVTLFSAKNFDDTTGFAQGVSGKDECVNVPTPDAAESLTTNGSVKIWADKNCTGKSAIVTDDVADLSAIGFDKTIASIRFGTVTGAATGGAATTAAGSAGSGGNGGSAAGKAGSAILFSEPNFDDTTGFAQAISGVGCRNVPTPGVASSVSTSGTLKLWSGPDCTGSSVVINGDVADLARVNFDDRTASVFFG